jgi:sodium-dependent dicarboxylate transporter 2/3/5
MLLMLAWSVLPALPQVLSPAAARTLGVAWLMACWWVTEALPIPATSLVPLLALPLLNIVPVKAVAPAYADRFILLMMAGFMLALAIEAHGLHKRMALTLLAATGTRPAGVLVSFMVVTGLLSMWISNTATTLIMLPIALAVVAQTEARPGVDKAEVGRFALGLFLCIAYSANVGGIGTPVGTPPNLIMMGVFSDQFPERELTFGRWLTWGVPFVLIFVPLVGLYVYTRVIRPSKEFVVAEAGSLSGQLAALGPMSAAELRVLGVFVATAVLWVTRPGFALGGIEVPGWQDALGVAGVDDSTVAVLAALVLFVLPAGGGKEGRLLTWETAVKLPWGLLLLFGGGIALARGFVDSGLSAAVGDALSALIALPVVFLVFGIALAVTFLTEITSNTATTTLLMPILAAVAVSTQIDPLLLMVPAAMSASCAFMLPVATAPNAIVFGTGRIEIRDMAKAGFALNLMGAVVITALMMLLV